MHQRFIIEKPIKEILNSNSMPRNTFVKSKRVNDIRALAHELGVKNHPNQQASQEYLDYNRLQAKVKTLKSQATKKHNKKLLSTEAYLQLIDEYDNKLKNVKKPSIVFPFNTFKVSVHVTHPDKRQIDPANLYPTIKPFLDGLTDSGWWEDDSLQYLVSIEFSYAGVSPNKNQLIVVDIQEVDHKNYITTYEKFDLQKIGEGHND